MHPKLVFSVLNIHSFLENVFLFEVNNSINKCDFINNAKKNSSNEIKVNFQFSYFLKIINQFKTMYSLYPIFTIKLIIHIILFSISGDGIFFIKKLIQNIGSNKLTTLLTNLKQNYNNLIDNESNNNNKNLKIINLRQQLHQRSVDLILYISSQVFCIDIIELLKICKLFRFFLLFSINKKNSLFLTSSEVFNAIDSNCLYCIFLLKFLCNAQYCEKGF
jgi:hypothetical protein